MAELDYSLSIVTAPASEPVSVSDALKQANVVAGDDDTYLEALLMAARELVERDANRALITQTLRLQLHTFPSIGHIRLPRPPLVSVSGVQYVDTSGDTQTWAATNYAVDTYREPGVLWLDEDADWPTTKTGRKNAVTITYVAGYGAASAVPQRAKQAILLLVGHWYRVREAVGRVEDEIALTYNSLIYSIKPGSCPS